METEHGPTEPELSAAGRPELEDEVRRFDPLDRAILEARLGLHGRRRQPLAQVAASFGVLPIKVRLVEAELTLRLRYADPALTRTLVGFLAEADRLEAAEQEARGIRPPVDRRRGHDSGADGPGATGSRRRGEAAVPDKATLAAILPMLTRSQVLISDELYGLVSGLSAPPALVAERLGVSAAEVRATDRLVRRLLAEQGTAPPAAPVERRDPTPEPDPDLAGTSDILFGLGDELPQASGS